MHVCVPPGRDVDFKQPRSKLLVQHDVEAEELVAAVRRPHVHVEQAKDVWL